MNDLGWHPMYCGLCPETWWLPNGDPMHGAHPFGVVVIGLAREHWLGHVARGEDPRIQGDAIKAYVGGAR